MPTEKGSSLRFCFKVWSPGASFIRSMGLGLLVRFFFFSCQRKKRSDDCFVVNFRLLENHPNLGRHCWRNLRKDSQALWLFWGDTLLDFFDSNLENSTDIYIFQPLRWWSNVFFAQILLSNAQVKMQNAALDFEDEASWYLWCWDISMQVFHVFCPSCVWKLAWMNVQNMQTTVDRSVATCDIHSLAIIPNSLQGLSSSLVTYTCTPCNPYHEGITTHSFNFTFLHVRQHFELEELYIYTYM